MAERLLPVAIDLHRHLVGGTTDTASTAPRPAGLHVFHGPVEDLDRLDVGDLLRDDRPSPE